MNRATARRWAWIAIFASCVCAPRVQAWDNFGHMQVAALAYAQLSPADRQRAAALLRHNPRYARWTAGVLAEQRDRDAFLFAATWADEIKADPTYQDDEATAATAAPITGYVDNLRHSYWHYTNEPFSTDATPLSPPLPVNVVTQLERLQAVLSDAVSNDALKSYALSWLLHLVGDVHQPLHCVARFDHEIDHGDRGGNLVKLERTQQPVLCRDPRYCIESAASNLHAFLDSVAGASCCPSDALTAVAQLPPAPAEAAANIRVEAWVQEGLALAQQRIYVAPITTGRGPFAIDARYAQQMLELARARIALAGARLARVLHADFSAEQRAREERAKATLKAE